jgi:hypothetical protein
MEDLLSRLWREIAERPYGPMAFRFYLQPLMSLAIALRDGLQDARAGKPPFFWALFTAPAHRGERLRELLRSVRKLFLLAVALDLVYTLLVLGGLRPVQTILVAAGLSHVPYVLLRGPFNRLARLVRGRWSPKPGAPSSREGPA